MPIRDDQPGDKSSPVARAIEHATIAGACRIHSRAEPKAAPGLQRAARKHHDASQAYLNEVVRRACADGRE